MCFVEESCKHHIAFQLSELGNAADMAQSGFELARNISMHASWLADLAHASRKCWLQAATFCSRPGSWPGHGTLLLKTSIFGTYAGSLCLVYLEPVARALAQGLAPPSKPTLSSSKQPDTHLQCTALYLQKHSPASFCETVLIQLDYSLQVRMATTIALFEQLYDFLGAKRQCTIVMLNISQSNQLPSSFFSSSFLDFLSGGGGGAWLFLCFHFKHRPE